MIEKKKQNFRKRFGKWVDNIINVQKLRAVGGCSEFSKRNNADMYIVSYPKSGRTWLRLMIGNYIAEILNQKYEDILDIYGLTSGEPGLPTVAFVHDGSTYTKVNWRAKQLCKSKKHYKDKKVVLLVRDPRDIVVSYYMHCVRRAKIYEGSISEFIRDDRFGVEKIVTFYNIWINNIPRLREFLLMRYEKLHEDPFTELAKLVEFIGVDVRPDILRATIELASFHNMRKMEQMNLLKSKRLRPGNLQDSESFKVRKGEVGGYVCYLSEEDVNYLNRVIERKLSPVIEYSGQNLLPRIKA